MRRTIKTIILISIFALLTVIAVSALNENNIDTITGSISSLSEIQSELSSSSSTRSISRVINSAIKQLNSAISQGSSSCISRLRVALSKLDRVAKILTDRRCSNSRRKNCIQDNLADNVLARLQKATNDLKEVTSLDEGSNGVPDICESDDPDGDGILGKNDNCPLASNPEQKDVDRNGIGDACDLFFCCEDSSLTVPLEECTRKTIQSCSEEGNVIIGCLAPLPSGRKGGKTGSEDEILTAPIVLNQITNHIRNNITFAGTTSTTINTGFFPFNDSSAILTGFMDFNCDDLRIIFTPPPGFTGGTFEIGPAANGFETGPRTPGVIGPDGINIILNNFPIVDPNTGQLFDPQRGDQLGLSLFTQDPVFVDSFFDIFVDLDFNGNCQLAPLSTSSSGGTGSSSGGTSSSGGVGTTTTTFGTSSGTLQDALNMSTVPVNMGGMAYMADYDCDDFAEDLGMELQGQGFNRTFTAIWRDNGMTGHAVTDIHTTSGGIVFVEPQNGMVIDLDESMDGMVGFSDGMHLGTFMATEGMTHIEVYMDRDSATMAGAPID